MVSVHRQQQINYSPAVNFVEDPFRIGGTVRVFEVLQHPFNKVILEYTLDDLMKEVRSDEFIYICSGEVGRVWLANISFSVVHNVRNHTP